MDRSSDVFQKIHLLIAVLFLIHCSGAKPIHSGDQNINSPFIILNCGGFKGRFNKKLGRTEENYFDFYSCISKKAFDGDSSAERQLVEIFPYALAPFPWFSPFRGEKLFPLVLNKVNRYDIPTYISEPADADIYFNKYGRFLFDMIESIDGIEEEQFVFVYIKTHHPNIIEMDPGTEEYTLAFAKATWAAVNDAYKKGLIKLKPYGQK
jgi:hypothetical protein